MGRIRRALRFTVSFGGYDGWSPVAKQSATERVAELLAEQNEILRGKQPAHLHVSHPEVTPVRVCLACGADLEGRMGCHIFIMSEGQVTRVAPGLLCVDDGANGANGMSEEKYMELLRESLKFRRLGVRG